MKFFETQAHGGALRMARVALGTMDFGTAIPQEQAFALMDRYVALGGNVIDTARVYGDWVEGGTGAAEKVVGAWMKARGNREQIVLVTKGGHPRLDDFDHSRLSREALHGDVQLSLQALQTDHIDVYFLHRDDPSLPVEPIIDALDELVQAGKIRAIGASNWKAERIEAANAYARRTGKTPFTISQVLWSLAYCTAESWGDTTLVAMDEKEHAWYAAAGMPVMAFTPQARGVLAQIIAKGEEGVNEYARPFVCEENIRRAGRVRELSERLGVSPAAIGIAYLTSDPEVAGCAAFGTSSLARLEDTLSAPDLVLDEATRRELTR